MVLKPGSRELLASVPAVVAGAEVRVLAADGDEVERFGGAVGPAVTEVRRAIGEGEVVASLAEADPAAAGLLKALLQLVDERERLESDMDSMTASSLRLLEQVATLGDTLPRLSGEVDERAVARTGVLACQVASAAERVVFLTCDPAKDGCEVWVDVTAGSEGAGRAGDLVPSDEGFVGEVLSAVEGGVVLRPVPEGGRLGRPGSPEHEAKRQVLGAPVTYGSGDKRVVLGALLLFDKRATSYSDQDVFGSEDGQVVESFAAMIGAVLGARKTAAFGKELAMAQMIQRQILPRGALELQGFDVAAEYEACGAVGGDYFDYVPMADGRIMVAIADVSGHNLASGMMMVSARATLRTLAAVRSDLTEFFDDFASAMYEDLTSTERFITAAALAMRPNDRTLEYLSAGHNDLLVFRSATATVEVVPTEHTILGFMPRPGYRSRTFSLEPGDVVLMYTDGITEALDADDEMFGEERLKRCFAEVSSGGSARTIVDAILEAVKEYRGAGDVGDDVTAVVVKCTEEGGL